MLHAAIIGASGYSGAELLRILSGRRDVAVEHLVANASAGRRIDELYPALTGIADRVIRPIEEVSWQGIDVAFVALPSGEGMKVVPGLLGAVRTVIDLGGDFRLPSPDVYEAFYGHRHTAPHLLGQAVYGLPELNRARIAGARFVANPGCYPTSVLLPLLPVLRAGAVKPAGISVSSVSGTSGAGRSASVEMSFTEVNENVRAYKVGTHQHIPEISHILSVGSGRDVSVSFVPHLVPMSRGIHTTIHADLAAGVTEQDLRALFAEAYGAEPFVRVRTGPPQVRDVVRTNYCDLSFTVEPRTGQLVLLSVIDNLVKGAAGQAVQNMNIAFGLPETAGLA